MGLAACEVMMPRQYMVPVMVTTNMSPLTMLLLPFSAPKAWPIWAIMGISSRVLAPSEGIKNVITNVMRATAQYIFTGEAPARLTMFSAMRRDRPLISIPAAITRPSTTIHTPVLA